MALLLLLAVPQVSSFAIGASCDTWSVRPIAPPPNLETVLKERPAVRSVSFLPADFRGVTLSTSLVLVTPSASRETLAHELAHVHQIRTSGFLGYSASYAWQWYAGLWHGCSIADARHAISFERQASLVGDEAKLSTDTTVWAAWDSVVAVAPPSEAISRLVEEAVAERSKGAARLPMQPTKRTDVPPSPHARDHFEVSDLPRHQV